MPLIVNLAISAVGAENQSKAAQRIAVFVQFADKITGISAIGHIAGRQFL